MSQPDRRTGSSRARRMLARAAVVAGATVVGTSAACLLACGASAEEHDNGLLGHAGGHVNEVVSTATPLLGRTADALPEVVDHVRLPDAELPSKPLPDAVAPVLDTVRPESPPPAPQEPELDVPEPETSSPAPESPEPAPLAPAPAPLPPGPGPIAPPPAFVPTATPDVAPAALDAEPPAAPVMRVAPAPVEPAPALPLRLAVAPAPVPPTSGSSTDGPGPQSADRPVSPFAASAAPVAGTKALLRNTAQHVTGAARPQPGTTPD